MPSHQLVVEPRAPCERHQIQALIFRDTCLYECLGDGLGSPYRRSPGPRSVVPHTQELAHKQPGTPGLTTDIRGFPSASQEQTCSRQTTRQWLSKSSTREPIPSHQRATPWVRQPPDNAVSPSHTATPKRDREPTVPPSPADPDRMVPVSISHPSHLENLARTTHGPCRHDRKRKVTRICFTPN